MSGLRWGIQVLKRIETQRLSTPEIPAILAALAIRRPVFHSEADFQHAIAWELQLADMDADIRLEKQVSASGTRVHLDLLVRGAGYELAIELKYKTRAVSHEHGGETYALRNQAAQDLGRHDFVKDVRRLETYTADNPGSVGYAILLTNDQTYWKQTKKLAAVDSQFRVHDGRVLHGSAKWASDAGAGTTHKRDVTIDLSGTYQLSWCDYSSLGADSVDQFRYLSVRVPSDES